MNQFINKQNTTLFLIISFFVSILIIQVFYLALINPLAFEYMSYAQQNNISPPRHFSVVLKDPEQKICLILFLWSLLVGIFYSMVLNNDYFLLEKDENSLSVLTDDLTDSSDVNNDLYKVLIENKLNNQEKYFGRTRYMTPVIFEADNCKIGDLANIKITSFANNSLFGFHKINKIKAA